MPKDFLDQMSDLMIHYGDEVKRTVDNSIRDSAKQARKYMKANSPYDKGNYSKSWSFLVEDTGNPTTAHAVVHNRKHYQLTHLLENGHWKWLWGKATDDFVGPADPYRHIEGGQRRTDEEFYHRVQRNLGKIK